MWWFPKCLYLSPRPPLCLDLQLQSRETLADALVGWEAGPHLQEYLPSLHPRTQGWPSVPLTSQDVHAFSSYMLAKDQP